MISTKVVLPLPDLPKMPIFSPFLIIKLIFFKTNGEDLLYLKLTFFN